MNIKNHNSVHLQDYPDLSFINDENKLVTEMDLVREICNIALSIRDQNKIRIRQALNKITIYNYDFSEKNKLINDNFLKKYKQIILDELNVKNIEIINLENEDKNIGEFQLKLNFPIIAKKYKSFIKDLMISAKKNINDGWLLENKETNQIIIFNNPKLKDISLSKEENEFEIKLIVKNKDDSLALNKYNYIVKLDLLLTEELIEEAIARDIVRFIQQDRKNANLNITDRININIKYKNNKINFKVILSKYKDYISKQILSNKITENIDIDNIMVKYEHRIENDILYIEFY